MSESVPVGQEVHDIFKVYISSLTTFLSSEKANRAKTPDEEEEIVIPKITYTITVFSLAELSKPVARRQPKARFVVLASDLEWPDVRAQLKIKAVDVLFPQQAAINDAAFEIEFSITRQVPTPLPLLSENDYKYLVQNALKLKANPAVKITIKEVAVNGVSFYTYLWRSRTHIIITYSWVPVKRTYPFLWLRGAKVWRQREKRARYNFLHPSDQFFTLSSHRFLESLTFYLEILPKMRTSCACVVDGSVI
jgi:hypothetical protein